MVQVKKHVLRIMLAALTLLLVSSACWAAMGDIQSFTFRGVGEDLLGPGENPTPDGTQDPFFSVTVSGIGALTGFVLQNEDGTSVWDTVAGNNVPGMMVKDSSGNIIVHSGGSMPLIPLVLGAGFTISVHDDGAIARGGKFALLARFADGSRSQSVIDIPASEQPTPAEVSVTILSAEWTGTGTRDLTRRDEQLRGDGKTDMTARISVEGKGVLTGIVIRSVAGEKGAWDTVPANRAPLIAVTQGDTILNASDGNIEIPLDGQYTFDLLLTDTGAIARGKSLFEVALVFSDGSVVAKEIAKEKSEEPAAGEFSGSAVFAGPGNRDLVGRNERRQGNGNPDWKIDLKVETLGTISGIKVFNSTGPAGEWDTIPGNGRWLIAATGADGKLLNTADGSVRIAVPKPLTLQLWVEDNGSLEDSNVRSKVTLFYDDGRELTREIVSSGSKDQETPTPTPRVRPDRRRERVKREIFFSNPRQASSSDYVGPKDQLRKSGKKDWLFEFRIEGNGTVKEITVEAVDASFIWDTVPKNRNWVIGVLVPGKGLLNKKDGSVSFEVPPHNNLQLFVEDNGVLKQGASQFEITVTWSDGARSKASNF